MTAVERIVEYETADPEAELETLDPSKKPPAEWPEEGEIKFDRLSLRYCPDPNTDSVLKDLEFHILPKEKVGVKFTQTFVIIQFLSHNKFLFLDCRKNRSRQVIFDQRIVSFVVQRWCVC